MHLPPEPELPIQFAGLFLPPPIEPATFRSLLEKPILSIRDADPLSRRYAIGPEEKDDFGQD